MEHLPPTPLSAPGLQMGALVEQLSAALHAMLSAAAAVGAAAAEAPPASLAQLSAAAASLAAAMQAEAFPAPPPGDAPHSRPFALPTFVAAHGFGNMASQNDSLPTWQPTPGSPPPRASFAAFRTALLPLAVQLAVALLPHWPPPQLQQAEQLELARAVAACLPGCCNLRCPDWQEQCKRVFKCAGCKTARFCSSACQKEAWRRGHKTICKLLGAPAPAGA